MAVLTWTDTLALQQPRMDNTHREFVGLLNGLAAALEGPHDLLMQSFQAFVDHTDAHFAQEDRWMQALGFAVQNCHHGQHAQVLELVQEVQRRLVEESDVEVVRALVPALGEWFVVHAQTMDAGLAQTMAEYGYDPETGTTARAPADAEAAISGCSSHCG